MSGVTCVYPGATPPVPKSNFSGRGSAAGAARGRNASRIKAGFVATSVTEWIASFAHSLTLVAASRTIFVLVIGVGAQACCAFDWHAAGRAQQDCALTKTGLPGLEVFIE